MLKALALLVDWKIEWEPPNSNKSASLLAQSVTKKDRLQSYVAIDYPLWLKDLFLSEALS